MSVFSLAELSGHVPGLPISGSPLRIRSRPCACGTDVVANADDPAPAVERHNRTASHLRWWQSVQVEWQGEE